MVAKIPTRVGFVGLGNIGKPMAERLARAGVPLTVLDADIDRTRETVRLGAVATASLSELAKRSDLVSIVVRTTQQVADVVLAPDGLLTNLAPGSIIAVHSTMERDSLKAIAKACAARDVALLDAPISGGETGAQTGTLTFMIGGEIGDLERCRPLFELMAGKIFHLGGVGAGQAGKLVNNLLATIGIIGATEAIRLAAAAGIAETEAAALLRASSGNNNTIQHWEYWREHIREEGAPERISDVLKKDVALALAMADELGLDLPLGAVAGARVPWSVGLDEDS